MTQTLDDSSQTNEPAVVHSDMVPHLHTLLVESHVGADVDPAHEVAVPHLHTLFEASHVGAVVLPLQVAMVPHMQTPD